MKVESRLLAALIAVGAFITGCDTTSKPAPHSPPSQPTPTEPVPSATEPAAAASSSAGPQSPPPAGPRLPKPTAAEAAAFAKASNAFAFDLHRVLASKGGNGVSSPASITTALAMTWGGAVGTTSDEMRKVLHFEGPTKDVLEASGKVLADLSSAEAPLLAIANRLFGEKTFTFEPAFLGATEASFGAPLEPIDFVGAAEPARVHINGWVATRTRDRIKDLIPSGAITQDTRLVLVNAVYFLADWENAFERSATRDAPFWVSGKTETPVPTMRRSGPMPFAEVDGTQVVELPYVGGRYAMLVAIPADKGGLDALERSLDAARYGRWVEALAPTSITLAMPKLEIDPPKSTPLRDVLSTLGMKTAFDRDHADFTKIANPPRPADRLFIGNVFHKAFVKVDEKGTEAAAATAVVMPRGGGMPPKLREVSVDRPFLFFIRDKKSSLILFAGRVVDPKSKG